MLRKVIAVIPGLLAVGTGGSGDPEADVQGNRIRPCMPLLLRCRTTDVHFVVCC